MSIEAVVAIGIMLLIGAASIYGETQSARETREYFEYEEAHRHCLPRPYKRPKAR